MDVLIDSKLSKDNLGFLTFSSCMQLGLNEADSFKSCSILWPVL